jgi:protein involved in polysaccharide export with SLBB domain
MIRMKKRAALLAGLCLALGLTAGLLSPAARAQQQQLTEEQLQMLLQLPPQQREALMRSLGIETQPPTTTGSMELSPPPDSQEGPIPIELPKSEPRLGAKDSLVLALTLREGMDEAVMEAARQQLSEDRWLGELEGSNAFQLDAEGVLHLPGVASIPLAGLTADEAEQRISAEDSLEVYEADVTILRFEETGGDALRPFGYLTFKGRAAGSFQPPMDIPVPQDYVVGPGDTISVQLFGNVNAQYDLLVNRDGTITFPEIGPIPVAGLEFSEMKNAIEARIGEQMIGVRSSITMGTLRSMQVFVLGDVDRPGSFTVSSLSTVSNALFVSGGVAPGGTLRDIQIKRRGKLVQRVDGYEIMLRGDTSADIRLQPGDVIFVPTVGPQVGVAGEVKRAAIYEVAGERTVEDLIALAGGVLPTAFEGQARLERIDDGGQRTVLTLDLTDTRDRNTSIRDGDIIHVDPVLDRLTDSVRLAGHVYRPGAYQWRPGMRLSDLLPATSYLKPRADRHYVLLRREQETGGPITVISADLAVALSDPGGPGDIMLHERDEVLVFDLEKGRGRQIAPILAELDVQASFGEPRQAVVVSGQVRAPGKYPLEPNMRVSDLLRAGAGLAEAAYGLSAELTRYRIGPDRRRVSELVTIDLSAVLSGDPAADLLLQPYDVLNIHETPLWRNQWTVEIQGEVNFPGRYAISPGETLASLLERAGGLTEFAFPDGSVFFREDLRERERQQLERLANRMESDLATLSVQAARFEGTDLNQSMSLGRSLLSQLRSAEPTGRLVIDLPAIMGADDPSGQLVLKDGDMLVIPQVSQEVTVVGEVQYPTSHLNRDGLGRDDYIAMSGGMTVNADRKRIYVVKANGAVQAGRGDSKWFRRDTRSEIKGGDTIVVPLDVDRVPSLALWQTSTTILFNLAIAAAAVGSL